MQRVFPDSNDGATADLLPQAPVDRCQDVLVAKVTHAHVAEDRNDRARRGKAGHKPPLGKLLAHALKGGKQRPIKEGTLRIGGKATALERGIARTLPRNRRDERLTSRSTVLLANIHPLRAPWGKALAHARKLRPVGMDEHKRLVRQQRIRRSLRVLSVGWGVRILRARTQVPEHHARRTRTRRVRDVGKRRVGREALRPPGSEAADGSLKALVCDQLIEEGDASGRRVLQAHDAGPEGHHVCNRRRGVGSIDSGSARPHDAFEPVEFLQTQRAPRNRYREVERRATRLRHARLGLGSRSGKHAHGDAARSGSVEPARTHALGEHQAIGTLHLEEAGKHRSIEGAGLVEKLGPHVRREEEHRMPLLFKRPLRAKRGGCNARSHTGDEHDFAVGFSISEAPSFGKGAARRDASHAQSTYQDEPDNAVRRERAHLGENVRPRKDRGGQIRSLRSASPSQPSRRATRCRWAQGQCRSRR